MTDKREDEIQGKNVSCMGTELDYREVVIKMVRKIDETDHKFLLQIYTIIHRHIEKRGH